MRGGATDIDVAVDLIAKVRPDILVMQSFDYDLHGYALTSFADALRGAGLDLPHQFARAPNTGVMTDVDLDGDGRTHTPRDAQGYGWFAGQGGMAVLSRYPILNDLISDHSTWSGPTYHGRACQMRRMQCRLRPARCKGCQPLRTGISLFKHQMGFSGFGHSPHTAGV